MSKMGGIVSLRYEIARGARTTEGCGYREAMPDVPSLEPRP